jgi:hypothetical protein
MPPPLSLSSLFGQANHHPCMHLHHLSPSLADLPSCTATVIPLSLVLGRKWGKERHVVIKIFGKIFLVATSLIHPTSSSRENQHPHASYDPSWTHSSWSTLQLPPSLDSIRWAPKLWEARKRPSQALRLRHEHALSILSAPRTLPRNALPHISLAHARRARGHHTGHADSFQFLLCTPGRRNLPTYRESIQKHAGQL